MMMFFRNNFFHINNGLDKHAPRKAPLFLVLGKGPKGFQIFVFPLDPTKFPMMLNISVVPKFPHVPQVIPIAR